LGFGLDSGHEFSGLIDYALCCKGDIMNQIFTVEGMTCGHCEKAVTKALLALDAQAKVVIDRTQHLVQVDSEQSREALAQAIAEEGYRVAA
jgi:copper chaperone